MLIGLVGKKYSGKDTLANYLVQKYNFKTYAYAKPLKNVCKELFMLSDDQLHNPQQKEVIDSRWGKSPRQLLQFIGTDIMRNQFSEDFWIKYFNLWYLTNKESNVAVTDCRFQNELDAVKLQGGIIIKLERITNHLDHHSSEMSIDTLQGIDFIVDNNSSIETLYEKIDNFMSQRKNL